MRGAQNSPKIGELKIGQLSLDEEFGFGGADKTGGSGGVLKNAIERLEFGCETVIGLN